VNQSDRPQEEVELLLNQVLEDQEELRAALARELHGELGALLTGMSLELSAVARGPEVDAALDSSRALLREAVVLKRRFIERLYPSTLSLLGLGPAVEGLARTFAEAYGVTVEARIHEVAIPDDCGLGIDLYRVAEAALENVARHAAAGQVEVMLSEAENGLTLVVRDDGTGFDVARAGSCPGFRLMRYRLGRWGGALELQSSPGQGAMLTARASLPGPTA